MITQHPNIYISPNCRPAEFMAPFREVLEEINMELNRVASAFYSYEVEGDKTESVDNLFRFIERTWVGVFNNALNRHSSGITTLQEFSVWGNDKAAGRCDLLFRYHDNNDTHDFITEAKTWEFFNNWGHPSSPEFYFSILSQAYKYYAAEVDYYKAYKSNIWLLAFVVEWVRDKPMLEAANAIMNEWNHNTDNETDFITLYKGKSSGAFIYGKFMSVEEFKKTYLVKVKKK